MWEDSPNELAVRYQVSTTQLKPLKSTAEHLQAKQNGGKDIKANIVAACLFCNSHRHKSKNPKDALSYKEKVKLRMIKGSWTSVILPNIAVSKILL